MDELVAKWIALMDAEGMTPRPPLPHAERQACLSRFGGAIPTDLLRFFELCDGAEVGDSDEKSWISLWEFGRVVPLRVEWPDEPESLDEFIVIADQGIRAWDYAIRLGEPPNPVVIPNGTSSPTQVAESFSAFLTLLILDPVRLYPPAA